MIYYLYLGRIPYSLVNKLKKTIFQSHISSEHSDNKM